MDEIVAGIPRNIVADMARSMRNREIERPAAYLKSLVSRYNDGRYNMIENQKCKRTEKESTKKPALRGDCVYVHEKSGRKATLSSSGDIIMRSPDDEIPRKISVEKFVKILQADPDFWREEPAAGAVPDLRGLVADLVNGVSTHVSHMGSSTH
ncbi:hypothetical protein BAE29_12305 [Acidithiobacillus caldus]|nr:hypothetical protein BAE28_16140 [Acidithiobacillus caldus]OFC36819.1 hypothetical protein BAE29_12305 [Acidithiobacillus caldus]